MSFSYFVFVISTYECSEIRSRSLLATTALWTFIIPVTYAATEEHLEWWNETKKMITKPRAYKHHLHSIRINTKNEKLKIKRMPSHVAFMCATVLTTHSDDNWPIFFGWVHRSNRPQSFRKTRHSFRLASIEFWMYLMPIRPAENSKRHT